MSISESVFQAALERALNAPERNTRVQRINSGDVVIDDARHGKRRIRGAKKGTGDLVGFVRGPGIYLEIEAKAHNGTLNTAQKARRDGIRAGGGIHLTVWAEKFDLERSVREALEFIDASIADELAERAAS